MDETNRYDLGSYVSFTDTTANFYLLCEKAISELDRVQSQNFDRMLHKSVYLLFQGQRSTSFEIKQRLCNQSSEIEPILEQEPILKTHFSQEEHRKIPLLWIAVMGCYHDTAELLVILGADVNEPFGTHEPQLVDPKWTILHFLLRMKSTYENEQLIRLIADHGADLQARDSCDRSLLHVAVMEARVEMVELLIEKGADVNATDDRHSTPLLIAAMADEAVQLMPLLMKNGADITAKDDANYNVLHSIASNDAIPEAQFIDITRDLINMGVPLHEATTDDVGKYQPIHLAAAMGHGELVDLFLDHGADVNALAIYGESPLYLSVKFETSTQALEALLARGADVHIRAETGRTALHCACIILDEDFGTKGESIKLLMSAGADPFAEDRDGKTPFALLDRRHITTNNPGIRPMLKALAFKKACQPLVELKDEKLLPKFPQELRNYYQDCLAYLLKAKFTRIIGSRTFFDLLTKSSDEIAEFMRNPNYQAKFKSSDLSIFNMYAEDIRGAFESAEEYYRNMLQEEEMLDDIFGHIFPYTITRNIVSFL